ncbi:MAG TPA: L,D-transpeptidase [Candidatus Bathyarchaeia archaeon]|nr:L,D-transpeptidase [Candidatus Bathyarchaeia archaeon]
MEEKEIVIRRDTQMGGAYEWGILVKEFPILFGDDEGPLATPEGVFRVKWKSIDYYSRKYKAPMPYSLFFTDGRNAIHSRGKNFVMPNDPEIRRSCRTHGCISVDNDIAPWLFNWAKAGPRGTEITIIGYRR